MSRTVLPCSRHRGGGFRRQRLFRPGGGSKQIVRREGGFSGLRRFFPEQLGLHGPEFQLLEKGLQFFRTGFSFNQFRQGHRQGNVPVNGGQLLGKGCHGPVFLHNLFALPFQFIRIRQQVFHGSELSDQQLGRLFPHAGKPRNIVGAVAHQGQNINYLVRTFNAPLLLELCQVNHFVVIAPFAGFPQKAGGGNKLAQVLVLGNHVGLESLRTVRDACQRAYRIVRLIAFIAQNGNIHGLQQSENQGHLVAQLFRHGFPVGFIGRVKLMARRGSGSVETGRDVRGAFVLQNAQQRIGEAVHGGSIDSLGIADGIGEKGEVGSVSQGHSIQNKKALGRGISHFCLTLPCGPAGSHR